jgi:cellulose synthase/poly-beta-1,6-N-acetylglucosamine synthase-like glycosyltransferase
MDQERSSTVHWLNGSNLLIRSDIEQEVGWDFINCFISEDARFGYESTKKLGKIFGWHGGLTIETPPASIKGLLKQRTRWYFGSILNLRYVPKARLPRRIYSITAWLDGLILVLFLLAIITRLYPWERFSQTFIIYGLTVALFLLARYQIMLIAPSIAQHYAQRSYSILVLFSSPVIDFLCNSPTVLAFIQRPKAFEITAKKG